MKLLPLFFFFLINAEKYLPPHEWMWTALSQTIAEYQNISKEFSSYSPKLFLAQED